jgi:hypothetical protein
MAASDGYSRRADDGEGGRGIMVDVNRMPSVEEEATAEDDETRVVCSVEVVAAAVVDAAMVYAAVVGTPVVVSSHAVAPAPLVLPAGHAAQPFDLAALYFPAVQIVHTAAPPTE